MFGYTTVLPGAFSAYQYVVPQNDAHGEHPLRKYFLGETMVRRSLLSRDLSLMAAARRRCEHLNSKRLLG